MTGAPRINETDAVKLAGVSARTLLRFSESGYLTVEVAEDGSRLYSADQLSEIFGAQSTTTSAPMGLDLGAYATDSAQSCNVDSTSEECARNADVAHTEESASPLHHETSSTEDRPSAAEPSASESEVHRLRNLLSMQERILDAKDDEIADLRSQRSWLRERIEKLEEKSDRDQILLLSETQTIRKLISYQESRKTVVQTFLEWIGISQSKELATIPAQSEYGTNKPKAANGRTIEVPTAANDR